MKNSIGTTLIVTLLLGSCRLASSQIQSSATKFSYPETILPMDTTKLWIEDGDKMMDTVTIFCQGGPKDVLNFAENSKSSWRYLPNYNRYYRVHLHQANTYNPDMFHYENDFIMDMARNEVDKTSEMLYRAISYFKDRGKTVWVLGHSYGAFVVQHYLATRPSLADKYVIISGRIDDPKNVVAAHAKGYNGIYQDGSIFVSDEGEDFSDYNEVAIKYYTGKQRLKAAIGEVSYSDALTKVELSGSIYIYSASDQRVGKLTKEEIDFLKSKGMIVIETKHQHGETIYGLVDAIKEGKVTL